MELRDLEFPVITEHCSNNRLTVNFDDLLLDLSFIPY